MTDLDAPNASVTALPETATDNETEVAPQPRPSPPAEPERRFGHLGLAALVGIALLLFGLTLSAIFAPVVLGALMAAFLAPLRARLTQRLGGRSAAAAIATMALLVGAMLPVAFVATEIVLQLDSLLSNKETLIRFFGPDGPWQAFLAEYPTLKRLMPAHKLAEQATAAVTWVGKAVPKLLGGAVDLLFDAFVTILTTYYLLRDGGAMGRRIEAVLPIAPRHTQALTREFALVARAVVIGSIGTALAQGVVGGLGFWVLGLEQPLLLGALTAALALVPAVGSGLVWAPAALYLLATGETTRGIVLIAFGLLVVSTIDNVVRPLLARAEMSTHPLLVFLGLFGGLASFGVSGLYLGPLFVALFAAVARIYEREVST